MDIISKLIDTCKLILEKEQEKEALYDWSQQARDSQKIPKGDWRIWLILAGRGFGKTRTGAETIRAWVNQKKASRIALVGKTEHDVQQVMVQGKSGLLSVHPQKEMPSFVPSRRQVTWKNGAVATLYSSECPDKLRGPQFDGAWIDEIAKFKNPSYVWDMLNMALRIGEKPQIVMTTTPRNIPFIRDLLTQSKLKESDIVVTRGTTFENADNLANNFLASVKKLYGNSALGRQELYAEVTDNKTERGLWTYALIDQHRYRSLPELERIVISVDPAVTNKNNSDETGILALGQCKEGRVYVLEDASGKMAPMAWGQKCVKLFEKYKADRVVAEVNQGGDLVQTLLSQISPHLPFRQVRAMRSKQVRAEPVAALYEQGKIFHPFEGTKTLENQMISFGKGKSPDRVDALVWGVTDLLLKNQKELRIWRP